MHILEYSAAIPLQLKMCEISGMGIDNTNVTENILKYFSLNDNVPLW